MNKRRFQFWRISTPADVLLFKTDIKMHQENISCKFISVLFYKIQVRRSKSVSVWFFFKMGHPRPLFLYFCLLKYTVDSKQMFNINKFLPMTGFELRTSGIGTNALPTEPQHCPVWFLSSFLIYTRTFSFGSLGNFG